MWRAFWTCLLFALFCSPALALDRDESLTQLYHTPWNERNGLTGSVTTLAQTMDGYLWVGTTNGLFRFDGLYFEPYKPEGGPLPSASVSALMALADGGLWVGYSRGGASLLKDGRATNYSERDGFPVGRVRSFARDRDGTIWAGVVGGFTRLEGSRWQTIRMDWNYPSKSAWTLFVDPQGTLWVSTGKGIMFLPRGERKFQDTGLQTGAVLAFAQAPDGTMWFHDNDAGSLRGFRTPTDSRTEPLPQIKIPARSILFDRDGALWLAGTGLSRVLFPERLGGRSISETSPETERFTHEQGLTDDIATAVLEDREGNIWVGTEGGLNRFRYRNLLWFPFPAGTSNFSLAAGDNGEVWVGSWGDKVWPVARALDGVPVKGAPAFVYMMYRDPDGFIWISAKDKLLRWQGGEFTEILPPEEMLKLVRSSATKDPITVSAITKDGSGTMWVGIGGGGVFQLKDGVWKFTETLKEHPDWAPNAAFTDGAGRVWLAYGDRVAAVERGAVRTFTAEDGLAVGPFNIIAGRDRQVWVGGESGLAFLQGDRFHILKGADGNGLGSITGIVSPPADGLWLSAGPGIVHISENEMQRALQQPDYKVSYEVFDLVSDLPEQLQRSGSYSSSAVQGSDGLLWFATRSGIARVNPAHILRNPVPPPVVIRSVIADERFYSTSAQATLPPLTKSLQIDYTALSLTVPERVRFRYKLEGWDKQWHDAGTRRQAFYTNLGPGTYSFRVIACNNDGVWNEEGATMAFTIAPAWYQTDWFMALCIISVFFVVWAVYRFRVRQVARVISARFDERLAERTRLAQELHDTFLQTVQGSKMVAEDALEASSDPVRMRRAMEQLVIWLGQATNEGRAALNSLRSSTTEQNDLAEAFRRATQNGLLPNSMTVNFSVAGEAKDMHPIVRDEIYRIGYEAIRNAYAHSGAGRLELELKYAQDLSLRVSDNGVGIDPSMLDRGKEGHFGLQGMRERAARIGAKLTFVSSPASGTEITLVVPGNIIFRNPRATRFAPVKAVFRKIWRALKPE
jgi:signal transduction histidine kinase/ligand-binding sensor domain-containing protein